MSPVSRGIDAAAHNGGLAGGTIAVVAGGIDVTYPPENADLQDIVESGLLLAEMPPGTQPAAAFSDQQDHQRTGAWRAGGRGGGTVRIADHRRGRLIAAAAMAVPAHHWTNDQLCNHLIREGAILVRGTADILEALARPSTASLPDPSTARRRLTPGPPEAVDRCHRHP